MPNQHTDGPGPLAVQLRDSILSQLAAGKRLTDLGLPVTPQAISKALKDDPDYREAIEQGLAARLDAAERLLDSPEATPEQVDVSRASARFRAVSWRAERECPARWGQVNKLTGADGGPVQVQVVRFGQTIEGEPVADVPNAAALVPKLPAPG